MVMYTLLQQLMPLTLDIVLGFGVHIHQPERILYEILLDMRIEGRISCETGCMIHLNEVRFEFVVEKDIEPQDLEAHVVSKIIRLTGTIMLA